MKKKIATLLVLVMAAGTILAGCGKEEGGSTSSYEAAEAVKVLEDVWAAYGEDEKFFAMGGDYTTLVDGAPGKVDISLAEDVDALLAVPTDATAMADDAASLIHAMNANTFTCSVFHVTEEGNMESFAELVKEHIANRQWMCGFPEELKIANVNGQYVVVAFGAADIMGTFAGHLETVTGAEFVVEENLAQ